MHEIQQPSPEELIRSRAEMQALRQASDRRFGLEPPAQTKPFQSVEQPDPDAQNDGTEQHSDAA